MTGKRIGVLVVDDSATYRSILSRLIGSMNGCDVLGTAPNGKLGLEKVEALKPDLVTLDIEMPIMDGMEMLKRLTSEYPDVGVVVVSSANAHSADQTVEALSLGCLEFIVKPATHDLAEAEEVLKDEIRRILSVLRKKMALRGGASAAAAAARVPEPAPQPRPVSASRPLIPMGIGPVRVPRQVDLIAIGSSTGGPRALEEILKRLPGTMPVPIAVVQHMPPVFTRSLARNINEKTELHVCEASEGEILTAGNVYIAPGGRHMFIEKNEDGEPVVRINDDPPENSCRPSADVMFRSLRNVYRPDRVLCVVLTGMGSDGAKGVKALQDENGGYCITQSEKTCVVYGMPRAVVEAGLVCEVADLEDIAERIIDISMAGERAAL